MDGVIDWKKLAEDIRVQRARRKIGLRDVASEMMLSPATVSRIENGKTMTAEGFILACRWLEVEPTEYSMIWHTVGGAIRRRD